MPLLTVCACVLAFCSCSNSCDRLAKTICAAKGEGSEECDRAWKMAREADDDEVRICASVSKALSLGDMEGQ